MVIRPGEPPRNIRWYFVRPDTPFVPQPSPYDSSRWRSTNYIVPQEIGEIRPVGDVWVDGSPPPFRCNTPFGDADAWAGRITDQTPLEYPCCGWFVDSGVVAEASGAFGAIAVVRHMSGQVAEAETATGSTAVVRHMSGQVAEAEKATGSTAVVQHLVGQVAEAETATGSTAVVLQSTGQVAEAQGATGSIVFVPATPTNPTVGNCFACASTYTYWYISCSGVTGSSDCTAHNVSHAQMSQTSGNPCTWAVDYTGMPGTHLFVLSLFGSGIAQVQALDSTGAVQASWSTFSWNCLSANTLSSIAVTSCIGWPSTITVSPT